MRVPNGERAILDAKKLIQYCLNPNHTRGKHKARVFASVLGLTIEDALLFRSTLLEAVRTVDAKEAESDAYGQRYWVDFEMKVKDRSAWIRSTWIIRRGETFPRFVTAYVIRSHNR